jgi:hypothetical protein
VLLLTLLLSAAIAAHAQVDRIGVDPRVELLSVIFRLAAAPEYQQARIPRYAQAVDTWFAPWRNHEVVLYARQLRQTSGISFDAPMSLAIHVTDVEGLAERVPFETPGIRLDRRWTPASARRFVELARDFVSSSRFAEFLDSQKDLVETTNARHRVLVESADLTWFDRFFGFAVPVRYEVVSGLLTGSNSYGPSVVAEDGVLEVYGVQGITSVDAEGLPVLSSGYVSNLIHELSHSYINPLVDQFLPDLDPAGRRLYSAAASEMNAQGYGNGTVVLYETLVRASTSRYAREHSGDVAGGAAVDYERSRGFVWMGEVYLALDQYEADRTTYVSLADFMPAMVAVLGDLSYRAPDLVAAYEAGRPQVAHTAPSHGAEVPPALGELTFTFDKPMRSGVTVSLGSGSAVPRFTKAGWDETATVFRLECVLEPNKDYAIALNALFGGGFMSVDGFALRTYTLRFRTAAE